MSPFFSPWTGKLPFKVIEFRAFVQEYGLEEVVERELSTAHFENEKKMEKKWKAPGAGRTSSQARGTLYNHPEPFLASLLTLSGCLAEAEAHPFT